MVEHGKMVVGMDSEHLVPKGLLPLTCSALLAHSDKKNSTEF